MYGLITGGIIKVFLNNPKKFIEDFVVGFVESFILGLVVVLIGLIYEKLRHKKK